MSKRLTKWAPILLAGMLGLASFAPMPAAKTPAPISRDGLFKAIGLGGLTDEDLIVLIQDYGVDFQFAPEDERKLTAAKVGAKVVEAIRANYRVARPQPATASPVSNSASSASVTIEDEPDEIVAGGATPAGSVAAAIIEEEVEIVAGAPRPPQVSQGPPSVDAEEIVAGGAKTAASLPAQPPAVEPEEIVAGSTAQPPAVQSPPAVVAAEPAAVAPPAAVSVQPEIIAAAPPAAPPVQQPDEPQELIPAAPQRKVFPTLPAGLAPFMKGPHVVKVKVRIDEQGSVQSAQVISMTGEPDDTIARLATQSAQKWQFTPAQQGGKAVPSEQTLRFVL